MTQTPSSEKSVTPHPHLIKWIVLGLLCAALVAGGAYLLVRRAHDRAGRPAGPDGSALSLDCGNGAMMELARIPAGNFAMGSDPNLDPNEDPSEEPRHNVTFPRDFWMSRTEVTEGQYIAVMGQGKADFSGTPNLPAIGVSWEEAGHFCDNLSAKTGRKVRLPSEAEWEYTCRAGTQTPYAFGESLGADQAFFKTLAVADPKTLPRPVGSYKPNAWGLYDMHGNVAEWVADTMHADYSDAPADGSAWTTGPTDQMRGYRGGSWNNAAIECRSASRFAGRQDVFRVRFVGFRVVVEVR